MVAPKHWGYTRDQAIGDELLVSWADGDLTAIVGKELEERLLSSPTDRERVAVYARDCARTAAGSDVSDMLVEPREALLERCERLAGEPDLTAPALRSRRRMPASRTLFSIGLGAILTLAVIAWMLREFA